MNFIKRVFELVFSIIFTIVILIGLIFVISKIQTKKVKIISENSIGVIKLNTIIRDSSDFIRNLKDFVENKKIKAVVVKINSPGGAVVPSQEIYREIIKLKKKKKIYAYIQSLGASGAYYVASATDKIFANPGSVIGSIGVIIEFTNIKELLNKIGIKGITIKSGKFKDVGNPTREMTDEEKEYLKGLIMNVYNQFLKDVSNARKIPIEKLKKIADGRVFTGEEGVKLGLVDKLGNFDDLVDYIKKELKIKGKLDIVYPEEKKPLYKQIVEGISNYILSISEMKIYYK